MFKVFVVVEMFSGIVTNVSTFRTWEAAEKCFEDITGMTHAEYQERFDNGEDDESILGEDAAGTGIWENEIE